MIVVKTLTLTALVGFLAQSAFCADMSAREIVSKSVSNYDKDWKAALNYTYLERNVIKETSGAVKTTEVEQVSVVGGTPFNRLIAKDGKPLTGEEAAKENEKYEKAVAARQAETPEQRTRRLAKYESERSFIHEIPEAFNMKMVGRETVNGRQNYVIQLNPKEGYAPVAKNARIFSDIQGKLWVDEQDLRWTKAEAEVVNTISIGWVLARIGPGAHITLEQTKVDDEHWMPKEICVNGSARIMFVKNHALNETVSYSDYKRTGNSQVTLSAERH